MIGGFVGMMTAGAFGAANAMRAGADAGRVRQAQIEAVRKNRREVAAVRALGAELRAARQQIEIERRRADEAQAQACRLAARVLALESEGR